MGNHLRLTALAFLLAGSAWAESLPPGVPQGSTTATSVTAPPERPQKPSRASERPRRFPACSGFNDQWDGEFRNAVRRYWPHALEGEWCALKAQCFCESSLRPDAVSPAGAVGLCQFMEPTWNDARNHVPGITGRRHPRDNIQAAGWYMGSQLRTWYAPRPKADRARYARGGYNGGKGNIIRAWRLAAGPAEWQPTADELPNVTGRHAAETVGYLACIERTLKVLNED